MSAISREDRLELILSLQRNPGTAAAIEEIKEQREKYYTNLGRHLTLGSQPADQREIDFKRGVWYGALWAYTQFLQKAGKSFDQLIEEALAQKVGEDVGV